MKDYPQTGIEYLQGIKDMNRRLASLENEKMEYEEHCYSISSPNLAHERVSGGDIPHGLERKIERMANYREMLEAEYDELVAANIEARKALSKLEDKNSELFLREYFVLNHSYRQICDILHCGKMTVKECVDKGIQDFEDAYPAIMQ